VTRSASMAIFCEDNAAVFSFNDILIPIIVYFVLTMALHFALLGYFSANPPSKDYKEWKTQKLMNFIQALNALVTSFFVTAFYAWGFYSLDGSRESRWHGNNVGLMHALSLHIGLTLYDTWLYINYFPEKGIEFHTHHFMVTAAGLISLSTGRGGAWGAWLGVVEITNIPLSGITALPMVGGKGGTLHVISGTMLWVLFLAFRVINVPWCLYTFVTDIMEEGGAGGKARYVEAETNDLVNTIIVWFIGLSGLFLFLISSLWFYKITKGLVKTLKSMMGGGDGDKKKK